MSISFMDAILAGVTLVREAIQSQNYAPGSAGWKIAADGTAEFADLTIRSSDGTGANVVIENGRAVFTAASGWQIIIDPTNALPVIYFRDPQGDESGAINATGDINRSGLNVSSGPFAEGSVLDWRWVTFMGETSAGNSWNVVRSRNNDPSIYSGGWLYLNGSAAQMAVVDSADSTVQTLIQVQKGVTLLDESRLYVSARPGSNPALRVSVADPGHTSYLIYADREGSGKFAVDKDGNCDLAGNVRTLGNFNGSDLIVDGTNQGHGFVAFQSRSTNTTASGTEQIALTHTGAVLKSGRAYKVEMSGLCQNNTANTGVRIRVRKTNVSGAIWADTFTVQTPQANVNAQFGNQQIIRNVTGSTITTDLVMTWVSVTGGNSFLNAGIGLYIAFRVTDIGAASDFPTAQSVT